MMLPSHLLATILLCGLVSLVRPLDPRGWMLALAFGVVIDLDHLLQMPAYVVANGFQGLTPAAMLHGGSAWQGVMHTPWALLVVVPAALWFGSWIPPAFWALHMVQDFVVARHYVVFGSATEWAIVAALLAAVVGVLALHHRLHAGGEGALWRHALAQVGLVVR